MVFNRTCKILNEAINSPKKNRGFEPDTSEPYNWQGSLFSKR